MRNAEWSRLCRRRRFEMRLRRLLAKPRAWMNNVWMDPKASCVITVTEVLDQARVLIEAAASPSWTVAAEQQEEARKIACFIDDWMVCPEFSGFRNMSSRDAVFLDRMIGVLLDASADHLRSNRSPRLSTSH